MRLKRQLAAQRWHAPRRPRRRSVQDARARTPARRPGAAVTPPAVTPPAATPPSINLRVVPAPDAPCGAALRGQDRPQGTGAAHAGPAPQRAGRPTSDPGDRLRRLYEARSGRERSRAPISA